MYYYRVTTQLKIIYNSTTDRRIKGREYFYQQTNPFQLKNTKKFILNGNVYKSGSIG